MAPIDGAIGMKININTAQTTDVNISKAQPSKASGLGGVRPPSSKSATTLYNYPQMTCHANYLLKYHCKYVMMTHDCDDLSFGGFIMRSVLRSDRSERLKSI